ncbi:MAG TPA: hypothetical protein VGD17_14750 [Chitinophagaceae bacterium]
MLLKTFMLINLLGFSFIVSQAFFYLLALGNAQKNLQAPAYVELRNLIDRNLMTKFRIVYYVTLVSSITVALLTIHEPAGLLFITSAIACVALWVDVFVMFRGNIPLNKIIQTWTPDNYPGNWKDYRNRWFKYYEQRQVACIIAFLSLLTGIILT